MFKRLYVYFYSFASWLAWVAHSMTSLLVVTFDKGLLMLTAPHATKQKMDGPHHTLTLLLAFWKHCV